MPSFQACPPCLLWHALLWTRPHPPLFPEEVTQQPLHAIIQACTRCPLICGTGVNSSHLLFQLQPSSLAQHVRGTCYLPGKLVISREVQEREHRPMHFSEKTRQCSARLMRRARASTWLAGGRERARRGGAARQLRDAPVQPARARRADGHAHLLPALQHLLQLPRGGLPAHQGTLLPCCPAAELLSEVSPWFESLNSSGTPNLTQISATMSDMVMLVTSKPQLPGEPWVFLADQGRVSSFRNWVPSCTRCARGMQRSETPCSSGGASSHTLVIAGQPALS